MNLARSIRAFTVATLVSLPLFGQQPSGRGAVPAAKNLQLLNPKSDISFVTQMNQN